VFAQSVLIAALLLGITVPSATAQTFEGYACTVDCSGHEAGFEWAENKGITDPDDCGGNSNSFIEGCKAWAEQQDNADDEEEIDDEEETDE
jgi:hypothetical protein